jgi:hypothetical protein
VMVLAGSMVKIKGEGMLSFFFLLCFIFIFNCTHFPLSCQHFPLIFIQFFHSIFFFFPLKYLLSLSLFPPFFLNLFLFFVTEPFYLCTLLIFSHLLLFSLFFFLFFFQPYPLAVRERVCNVHISPMSLQLYYARQTLIFFFWFFRKKNYFENSSIFIFCRIINFFIPPLQKNSYNLLLYAASILTRHWLGFVRERGWNRPPSNFNFFYIFLDCFDMLILKIIF